MTRFATFLTAWTLLWLSSAAQALSVAYINASGGDVSYLNALGHTVTNINNPLGLTLGDLATYDAVMVASNSIFSESTNIGNVVADFADAGGGVVLTEFVFQGQWALGGRIMGTGYSPFTIDPLSSGYGIIGGLGTIYDPASELFTGVNTANVLTDFQAAVGLDAGAALIADWTSGRHAFGLNTLTDSSVIGLNLFPDGGFTTDPDTQLLVSNALNLSVQGGGQVSEPASLALLGLGLAGFGIRRRKRSV